MPQILYDDGEYEYVILSKDTLEGGLIVMREAFFIDEMVSVAVELYKYPNARKELEELCIRAARDGVSIVAVHKKTGVVAGALFNKLQVKGQPGDDSYFEKFATGCKEPAAKSLVLFMKEADEACDLFTSANTNCILELMFLAVLTDHRKKGIGKYLTEASIKLGKILLSGKNIKESITGEPIPLDPKPTAISALFTSFISQKIGSILGFVRAKEIDFNTWSFDGKTYAERIGPLTPYVTVEYKNL